MKRRGKVIALSTAAAGLVVLVATGFAARGLLLEKYWLWKLKTGSREEHLAAATALGKLKSVKAIHPLLESVAVDQEAALGRSSRSKEREKWLKTRTVVRDAFEDMGEAAMPELILHIAIRQYERPQPKTVVQAVRALDRIYKHPENIAPYKLIPWLQKIQNDRGLNVSTREAAARALAYMHDH